MVKAAAAAGTRKKRRRRVRTQLPNVCREALPYEAHQRRLYLLRGMPCPLCGLQVVEPPPLEWTGISLVCPRSHGWSNADALRADMKRRAAFDEETFTNGCAAE